MEINLDVEGDSGNSLSNYYYNAWNGFQSSFNSEEESTILNTNTEELISQYIQKYLLPTLEVDPSRQNIMEKIKPRIPREVSIKFGVPLVPKERIEDVVKQSASSRLVGFSFKLENGYLVTEIHSESGNIGEQHIKQSLDHLKATINHKNSSVTSGNQELESKIENYIPQVKSKLEKENKNIESLASKIPVNLVKKNDAGKTIDLQETKKIEPIKPKPEPPISSTKESSKTTKWDVFISHATEDKTIATALAEKLKENDLKVWYDQDIMKWGDSLMESINLGLKESLFGIVIFSKTFFKKTWAITELKSLVNLANISGEKTILPLLHEISHNELTIKYPILADIFARSTKDDLEKLATEIKNLVEEKKKKEKSIQNISFDDTKSSSKSIQPDLQISKYIGRDCGRCGRRVKEEHNITDGKCSFCGYDLDGDRMTFGM